ncbi:hypothetical protein MAPG_10462 [Magnaporthiopsis poae ATCC 64411]|uniref:Uncharacterized protein n=1 Tax=Magnaporthiopsis poae (strain ATCC 64411 / 73-15) TaxID=644358 RepID=A0A0C4ECN1_MAGP6|nr:hypothetical protein MAPG_10462 [Magnaporthiopsis poae ATCC 64411]
MQRIPPRDRPLSSGTMTLPASSPSRTLFLGASTSSGTAPETACRAEPVASKTLELGDSQVRLCEERAQHKLENRSNGAATGSDQIQRSPAKRPEADRPPTKRTPPRHQSSQLHDRYLPRLQITRLDGKVGGVASPRPRPPALDRLPPPPLRASWMPKSAELLLGLRGEPRPSFRRALGLLSLRVLPVIRNSSRAPDPATIRAGYDQVLAELVITTRSPKESTCLTEFYELARGIHTRRYKGGKGDGEP